MQIEEETESKNICQKQTCTIITALFDIKRERADEPNNTNALKTYEDYLKWFALTLKLNCNMIIFTEEKTVNFINENRPVNYNTKIIVQELENLDYYKYYDAIKNIIESSQYREKIRDNNRIECKLPEYLIIQYSKFEWLKYASEINPFDSKYFFWLDAGGSRFFNSMDVSLPFPSLSAPEKLDFNNSKMHCQTDRRIFHYDITKNFCWDSVNLIIGTFFGGNNYIIDEMRKHIKICWENYFIKNNCVNNEQLALAFIWKYNPLLFNLYINKSNMHIPLIGYVLYI